MIQLDPREGSGHLLDKLKADGHTVSLVYLECGDVAFRGKGPTGKVEIGIELKGLKEMLGEFSSPRFLGHQLHGLLAHYDWKYLIVEGSWKTCWKTGRILVGRSGGWKPLKLGPREYMAAEYRKMLLAIMNAGVIVLSSTGPADTRRTIGTIYKWWQEGWDKHSSLKAVYVPGPTKTHLIPPSRYRKSLTCQFPGVGYDRAGIIEKAFPTWSHLLKASEKDLTELDGIGPKLAAAIYGSMR